MSRSPGEMTEWPKVHDWKSCVPQGTEGSNPSLSSAENPPAAFPLAREFCTLGELVAPCRQVGNDDRSRPSCALADSPSDLIGSGEESTSV